MVTEVFKALHGSSPIYIRDTYLCRKGYNLYSTVFLKKLKNNTVTWFEPFRYKGEKNVEWCSKYNKEFY